MTPSAESDPPNPTSLPLPTEEPVAIPQNIPIEVAAIIGIINENINTALKNRERLNSYFDDSVGLSAWNLIPANDRTLLRDLVVQEMQNAVSGLQSAVNMTQNLT